MKSTQVQVVINTRSKIIEGLRVGKIGIMPTDTMYGLVGSAFNKETVERIYQVRRRNLKKPLIILVDRIDRLLDFGIKDSPKEILGKIWPDKITVILSCKNKKFEYLHRGTNRLGFRIPKNKSLRVLLSKTGPLVAPSANPEGESPATTITEAKKYFGDTVDFYFGTKKLPATPSTIIEINSKCEIILVREGAVKASGKKLKGLLQ